MIKKNFGPCSVVNCTNSNVLFRKITEYAYQKCQETNILETYSYLEIGMQLCHLHYCKIVEFKHNHDKNKRKKNSESQKGSKKKVISENTKSQSLEITNKASTNNSTFASKVNILTKVLFNIHRRKGDSLELEPQKFEKMIEETNPELKGFFPSMVNAIIPKEQSAHNRQEAKKSIVALCYMISGLRNKFVNQLKTEVRLYLASSGATWEAIDTMSSLGYSACSKTIEEYQKKIQKEHTIKIEQHFTKNKNILHIYNIDDYHSIHENRRPDTVSTSTVKHFATCVAKPIIESLCYMISGLRNKFVNQLKTEVRLYLASSGATWEAIDTMSSLGYSACSKTIEEYQKKIQKEHTIKIEQHFTKNKNILHIYNIDDYHSIHENRRPDTVSTSTVKHFATCVAKPIIECSSTPLVFNGISIHNPLNIEAQRIYDYHSIHENRRPDTVSTSTVKHFATCVAKPIIECSSTPLVFNGISIHNPLNIEAQRICWYLINRYSGVFDLSYLQKHSIINEFDRIEMLTIHNYNDNITERKEEWSMKDLQLIGFKEQNLHSIFDYINALKIILSIHDKTQHLRESVAPIVADWPGQIFIRKALYMQISSEFQSNFSQDIRFFLPMLGPLHVSLNSREQIMLVHHSFFEKLFHFVFGENKKLAKKPRPWRINLLLELAKCGWIKIKNQIIQKFDKICKDIEYRTTIDLLDNLIPAVLDIYAILFRSDLFEEYVETIFRIWTFALRWKRKNYNKVPLVFLSDFFYWKDHDHPFYNVLQNHLPGFNDYFVENTHSKIRANTSSNATTDNIIKQAYVIMNQDPIFKNTYCKTRNYPYNSPTLDFLSNKTSIFLLQYFHNLYNNLGKSVPKLNKKIKKQNPKIYILATLEEEVDLRRLPTGYSTSYPPKQGLCDRCKLPFINEDSGVTFICGHGYHTGCYNGKCTYCEEYYKRGFNDYFVENTHSKIRANTSSNATTDNIIKQAYVIMNQDPIFKNTYCKTRNYPYNSPTLDFLSNKTSIFLLQYFHNLYNNLGKSVPKLNKKIKKQNPKIYILATLEEEVDLRRLPTGYSTSYPPKQGLCDRCKLPFINEDSGVTFICGHGYHTGCYNGKCTYCEEYYKRGIFENVNSFLKRIEKGANTLTQEDLDDERNDIEEEQEQTEEIEMQDISNRLEIEINQIENW
ncbi:hypothetical protein Glove_16g74 [Diversispora epigaea]|uniref:Uncharacterized protein n=1 Tax=Diversispora epigaea TaxID=1348612 RepID=A0A397JLM7_9GLOM|nr:hypothetical protein Glove_16g74 [Diversispora epigaea]